MRVVFASLKSILLVCGLTACGANVAYDAGNDRYDASSDVASSDTGPGCFGPGTSQIRVAVQIAPGLDVQTGDVWVSAMCVVGSDEHAVRVVRADPTGALTTLTGLAAGSYVVRASTGTVASVASPRLNVGPGSISNTSLTLAPGDPPLVRLGSSATVDAGVDASATDASLADVFPVDVPVFDAGPYDASNPDGLLPIGDSGLGPDAMLWTAPVLRPGGTDVIGTAEAVFEPRDATNFDVTVRVNVTACDAGCLPLRLDAAEIRTSHAGLPWDFAITHFDVATADPGTTATSAVRTVHGELRAVDFSFGLSVFGGLFDADAGAAPRDR